MIAADLNGDGYPDLAQASELATLILLGTGDGTFHIKSVVSPHAGVNQIAIADFDDDGILDLLEIYRDDVATRTRLATFTETETGTFRRTQDRALSGFPSAIWNADFNNDGRTDLLTSYAGSNGYEMSIYLR